MQSSDVVISALLFTNKGMVSSGASQPPIVHPYILAQNEHLSTLHPQVGKPFLILCFHIISVLQVYLSKHILIQFP